MQLPAFPANPTGTAFVHEILIQRDLDGSTEKITNNDTQSSLSLCTIADIR